MSFAAPLAWKNLWRRPSRTLFSVLGVALGIATVVAIFTVEHNTVLFSQPSAEREPVRQDPLERTPRRVHLDGGLQHCVMVVENVRIAPADVGVHHAVHAPEPLVEIG